MSFNTAGTSECLCPGLISELILSATAFPKTRSSKRLFAPSLLAPCTDDEAVSPAAHSPSMGWSSSFSRVNTSIIIQNHYYNCWYYFSLYNYYKIIK